MDRLLKNDGAVGTSNINRQCIYPGINFTCDGTIQSWVYGAQWEDIAFFELQIWRIDSGDGVYSRVGSTTITAEQSLTNLYHHPLSTPLPFQAGDILGYYQPSRPLRLLLEVDGSRSQLSYTFDDLSSAASQLNIAVSDIIENQLPLISVVTGKIRAKSYVCIKHFLCCRASGLWVWFHECGTNAASAGNRHCR